MQASKLSAFNREDQRKTLMDLLIIGINHHTAPVALRETVAFTPEQIGDALHDLSQQHRLSDLAILSTCNRPEIYAIATHDLAPSIIDWLADYQQQPVTAIETSTYHHFGAAALRHLARVATGLDSMVLGEPQILGQLKDSFSIATRFGTMGKYLNRISQHTYRIAKQVRTETTIGESTVSAASTAVDLAAQLFTDFSECNALLVGAGETIEIVGRHLKTAGIKQIVIANRTVQNAEKLAIELGGKIASLNDISSQLIEADIVVTSTASQLPIIGKGVAERALKIRRHKPIFMVDLAVPRDIEPEVNDLRDVYLYSIDDLQQIIDTNLSNRNEAAIEAESIIDKEVNRFLEANKSLDVVDTLTKFRKQQDQIKKQELDKALKKLEKGEDPAAVLTSLANQLTNKIIHAPSVQMKQAKIDGREDVLGAIEHLFQLDD